MRNFLELVLNLGLLSGIMMIGYSMNIWNRYKRGFGRGLASSNEFFRAIKWFLKGILMIIVSYFLINFFGLSENKNLNQNKQIQKK